MKCDIFIKSYAKDFPWLKHCLKSISEKCKGFNDIIIVIPEEDLDRLKSFGLTREIVIPIKEDSDIEGYKYQQIVKLNADKYTHADYVMYADSDLYFTRDLMPEMLMEDGKPIILYTEYSVIGDCVDPWKKCVKHALNQDVPYEFMRRHPLMYPTWIHPLLREHLLKLHGKNLQQMYVKGSGPLSEFNVLGAYAWMFHRDQFVFKDTEQMRLPAPYCHQFWSHGGKDHKDNSIALKELGIEL